MLHGDVVCDPAPFVLIDDDAFARGGHVMDDVDVLKATCTLRYPFNNGYRSLWAGRYTSPDPLHLQTQLSHLGAQAYTYAANRPQVYQDPDGRSAEDVSKLVAIGHAEIDMMTAKGLRHPNFLVNNLTAFSIHRIENNFSLAGWYGGNAYARPYEQCQEQSNRLIHTFENYLYQRENELDDVWVVSLRTSKAFSAAAPFGHAWLVLRSMSPNDPDVVIDSLFNEVRTCPSGTSSNTPSGDQCVLQ